MAEIKTSDIISLPPLPMSMLQLANLLEDPNADIKSYARVIALDPILTASVLRWANSAYSQSAERITSVHDAVVRLGTRNIMQLSFAFHLQANVRKLVGGIDPAENDIWRHSVATAVAADLIGQRYHPAIPAGAFASAIIHDIGKILIARSLGFAAYRRLIAEAVEAGALTVPEAERKIARVDHVELGEQIASRWRLPDSMVNVVRQHHDPSAQDALVRLVRAADSLAKQAGIEAGFSPHELAAMAAAALYPPGDQDDLVSALNAKFAEEIALLSA
ncbi:MAG: HDOD domain-containing protein [candidate division FCPU426 bacterium]